MDLSISTSGNAWTGFAAMRSIPVSQTSERLDCNRRAGTAAR